MTSFTSSLDKDFICLLIALFTLSFTHGQRITFEEISNATKKPKGDYNEYVASNEEVFKVGEKLILGEPSRHDDTYQNIIITDGMTYGGFAPGAEGLEVELVKIKIQGTKRLGYGTNLVCKTGSVGRYWVYIEAALEKGEIASSVMTRSEAIAKLKEAKDLLDLEMMTQEEYDKLKKELEPIIRGNN